MPVAYFLTNTVLNVFRHYFRYDFGGTNPIQFGPTPIRFMSPISDAQKILGVYVERQITRF